MEAAIDDIRGIVTFALQRACPSASSGINKRTHGRPRRSVLTEARERVAEAQRRIDGIEALTRAKSGQVDRAVKALLDVVQKRGEHAARIEQALSRWHQIVADNQEAVERIKAGRVAAEEHQRVQEKAVQDVIEGLSAQLDQLAAEIDVAKTAIDEHNDAIAAMTADFSSKLARLDNDDLFNQLSLGFQRVVAIVNTTDALHQQIAGTELALARSQTQALATKQTDEQLDRVIKDKVEPLAQVVQEITQKLESLSASVALAVSSGQSELASLNEGCERQEAANKEAEAVNKQKLAEIAESDVETKLISEEHCVALVTSIRTTSSAASAALNGLDLVVSATKSSIAEHSNAAAQISLLVDSTVAEHVETSTRGIGRLNALVEQLMDRVNHAKENDTTVLTAISQLQTRLHQANDVREQQRRERVLQNKRRSEERKQKLQDDRALLQKQIVSLHAALEAGADRFAQQCANMDDYYAGVLQREQRERKQKEREDAAVPSTKSRVKIGATTATAPTKKPDVSSLAADKARSFAFRKSSHFSSSDGDGSDDDSGGLFSYNASQPSFEEDAH